MAAAARRCTENGKGPAAEHVGRHRGGPFPSIGHRQDRADLVPRLLRRDLAVDGVIGGAGQQGQPDGIVEQTLHRRRRQRRRANGGVVGPSPVTEPAWRTTVDET